MGAQMGGGWEPKWGALGSLWDGTPNGGLMGAQMGGFGVTVGWDPKVGWMGP